MNAELMFKEMFVNPRIEKCIELIKANDLDAVVLNPGKSLTYLSDLHFHLMERPTVLFITHDGQIALVLPELEKGKLTGDAAEFQAFTYGDDPGTWHTAFEHMAAALHLETGRVGVEPEHLRFLELQYLNAVFGGVDFIDGSKVFGALRLNKDAEEVAKMRQAAIIAQEALLATLRNLSAGVMEKAVANELVIQLLRAGSNPELPFEPIVAFGENSANPHAVPTDRALKPGDLILIDWGASFDGYLSDITRTFTFGEVDEELLRIGEIVRQANHAGRHAGKAGVSAGTVDHAARAVIEAAGYGEAFFHRTGHGLGMEAHEAPYIYAENDQILSPGMTFTVEPGIYLPGKGGVRIEDDVVVTADGLQSLTDLPREVLPVENFIR
jgi:Xaa-Pro dipeptidase